MQIDLIFWRDLSVPEYIFSNYFLKLCCCSRRSLNKVCSCFCKILEFGKKITYVAVLCSTFIHWCLVKWGKNAFSLKSMQRKSPHSAVLHEQHRKNKKKLPFRLESFLIAIRRISFKHRAKVLHFFYLWLGSLLIQLAKALTWTKIYKSCKQHKHFPLSFF